MYSDGSVIKDLMVYSDGSVIKDLIVYSDGSVTKDLIVYTDGSVTKDLTVYADGSVTKDQSGWDEREPSSVRPALEPYQRQRLGNFRETGWSTYGLFRAHRYHLELH